MNFLKLLTLMVMFIGITANGSEKQTNTITPQELIRKVIARDITPDTVVDEKQGTTALMHLVYNPFYLQAIIQTGLKFDLEKKDLSGRTALMHVIKGPYTDTVKLRAIKLLVDAGVQVSLHDNAGNSTLFMAITTKNIDIVQVVMSKCTDTAELRKLATTFMQPKNAPDFVKQVSHSIFKRLKELTAQETKVATESRKQSSQHSLNSNNGGSPQSLDKFENKRKPLLASEPLTLSMSAKSKIQHKSVETKAKIEDTTALSDDFQTNPADSYLHELSPTGAQDLLKLVQSNEFDVNAAIYTIGATLLMQAAHDNNLDLLNAIIKADKKTLYATDNDKCNALHYAASNGSLETANRLCELDASLVDSLSKGNNTPLMIATERHHPDLVELLLKKGASPLKKDHQGFTTLQYCIVNNNPTVLDLLLKYHTAIPEKTIQDMITYAEDRYLDHTLYRFNEQETNEQIEALNAEIINKLTDYRQSTLSTTELLTSLGNEEKKEKQKNKKKLKKQEAKDKKKLAESMGTLQDSITAWKDICIAFNTIGAQSNKHPHYKQLRKHAFKQLNMLISERKKLKLLTE